MKLPTKQASLFALAEDMADGQKALQTALGLVHHDEAKMRAALAASLAGQTAYGNAVALEATASTALGVADSNGKAFISAARKTLAPYLGEKWSAAWAPTGFPGNSLAVPSQQNARLTLLGSLKTYLTANPTQQNADPRVNVTFARAELLRAALDTARTLFNTRQQDTLAAKTARDTAVTALRDEMTGLLSELGDLLAPDDPRWLAFGVPLPGADHVPERPEHLLLAAGAPGVVNADWADTPRAEHYHIEAQIVGVDSDFKRLLTRDESDATLTGLPSNKTIKVRVIAVNAAGNSAASEVVEIKLA